MKEKSHERTLNAAREFCLAKGVNFTPLRELVFYEIVTNGSIGAYEIAHNLSSAAKPVNVVSVYRTLEFLLAVGLIYKITISKRFAVSPFAETASNAIDLVLICKNTGDVTKIQSPELTRCIARLTKNIGFAMTRAIVEIEGDGTAIASGLRSLGNWYRASQVP